MRGTGRLLPSKQRVARSNRAGRATFRRLFIWLFLSLPVGYWTRTDGGPNAAGAAVRQRPLRRGRIGYKSVSSLIPQALNLYPFRDAPRKQSLPLEPSTLFKSLSNKSLGSCAKICRSGRLFAIRSAWRLGGKSACHEERP